MENKDQTGQSNFKLSNKIIKPQHCNIYTVAWNHFYLLNAGGLVFVGRPRANKDALDAWENTSTIRTNHRGKYVTYT